MPVKAAFATHYRNYRRLPSILRWEVGKITSFGGSHSPVWGMANRLKYASGLELNQKCI